MNECVRVLCVFAFHRVMWGFWDFVINKDSIYAENADLTDSNTVWCLLYYTSEELSNLTGRKVVFNIFPIGAALTVAESQEKRKMVKERER